MHLFQFVVLALGYFANVQCWSNGHYSHLLDSVLLNLITLPEKLVYH